jgi:hypothetical protein
LFKLALWNETPKALFWHVKTRYGNLILWNYFYIMLFCELITWLSSFLKLYTIVTIKHCHCPSSLLFVKGLKEWLQFLSAELLYVHINVLHNKLFISGFSVYSSSSGLTNLKLFLSKMSHLICLTRNTNQISGYEIHDLYMQHVLMASGRHWILYYSKLHCRTYWLLGKFHSFVLL